MTEYILSVFSVVTISSIITMIYPNGKLHKFLKTILSVFVLIVIISPVINFLNSNDFFTENSSNTVQTSNLLEQKNYLEYIYSKKTEENINICENILKKYNVTDTEIDVIYRITESAEYKIEKIRINLKKVEFTSETEHKHIIDKAIFDISQTLNIDKENVLFYGK